MPLLLQIIANKGQTRRRYIAFAFLLCFIVISMFSCIVVSTRGNHMHDQNGTNGCCTNCALVTAAKNVLNRFSSAAPATLVTFGCFFAVVFVLKVGAYQGGFFTLVDLKTQMNN